MHRFLLDSVPHRVLLQKIKSAGMNRHISDWLFSYLFNREQFFVLNGRESPSTPVCQVYRRDLC